MSTLFISHNSSDNDAAGELARRLMEPPQNHHSVFLDLDPEKGIVAGQSWERTLYRKLRACRAVIALCTDNYLRSHWCFAEIALARMEGKHILALQVDPLSADAKMPSILTEKQFIDLRKNPEEAYQRLWRGLEELDVLGVTNEWDPKKPPYLGLSAYREEHAPVFFGRDDEIRAGIELLDRGAPGLITVLGASGSGKSSMVRAGIVPRLRRDADRWLIVGPFRPGRDPFAELTEALVQAYQRYAPDEARGSQTRERLSTLRALGNGARLGFGSGAKRAAGGGETGRLLEADARLPLLLKQLEELRRSPPEAGGSPLLDFLDWSLDDLRRICGEQSQAQPVAKRREAPDVDTSTLVEIADDLRRGSGQLDARVLLVIDQFEELLGHDDVGDDANRFLDLVRNAFEAERTPIMALATMRSDFLGVFQRNRALLGVDFESLSVGPMHVDGMRRIIEEPARLGAIELEQGLADRLLADTETPDALPLLSFTMSVLWKGRQNGTVSVRQYEELDGLHGAVAREAEAVLDLARRQGKEDDVRKAFLQMARLTEDGSYARLPVSWDRQEIRKVQPILEEFEKQRLLVTRMEKGEQRTVEVAHEALFRSWAPLKIWLDDHRAVLMLRAQLRRDARAWEENNRAADSLWHGGRLQQAEDLMRKGEFGGTEADGSGEEQFVRAGVRRRQRRRWTLAGITVLVFAVLSGFLWYAVLQKKAADAERDAALELQSEFLADAAEQQLSKGDAVTGALLALEGLQDLKATDERQRFRPYVRGAYVSLESAWRGRRERAVFAGHEGWVFSATFSPDGARIVTASEDKTARIWDALTGEAIKVLQGHAAEVYSAAFSPNGKRVVTASRDKTARVWAADGSGEPVILKGHGEAVNDVAFSPDGARIVTASDDMTARVWDALTGDVIKVLEDHTDEGHTDPVKSASFSPDGARVVTASGDWYANIWEVATGKVIRSLEGHRDAVEGATFSLDGKRVVTASADKTARIWAVDGSGEPVILKGHGDIVRSAAFSPDGTRILTASQDATARFWDAETGKEIQTLIGHEKAVNGASFSPDGARIVTASNDKTARVWGAAPGKVSDTLSGHINTVYTAAFSPDGTRILTASKDGTAQIWDAETGKVTQTLAHADFVNGASFSPVGARVVTASGDGTAKIWKVATGKVIYTLEGHADFVNGASFSPDGTRVVTASQDKTARIWDATTGKVMRPLTGHGEGVEGAAFGPDGKRVVTASEDKTARIWDVTTGEVIRTLGDHVGPVNDASFSPDGKRVVTASQDKTARIWDLATRKVIILKGHKDNVWRAAFSPDGGRIVTASQDKTARVWDAVTGEVIKVFQGHAAEVYSAAFSPDETRIVTASGDSTARVWDALIVKRQKLIDQTKDRIPRCLTPKQRDEFFLAPEPPQWCVERGKWPYQPKE